MEKKIYARISFISKKNSGIFPKLCGCSAAPALHGIHLISSSTVLFFYLEMMVIEIIFAIRWLVTGRMASIATDTVAPAGLV